MFRKWLSGLIVGVMLGGVFVAVPSAQNYIWTVINGVPYAPNASVGGSLTIGAGGAIDMGNAAAIRTGTATSDTLLLQAYDVDGTTYTTLLTLTAGNTPTLAAPLGIELGSTAALTWTTDGVSYLTKGSDRRLLSWTLNWYTGATLGSEGAGILQLGVDVNGSAVHQQLKAHDGITGTDISGANLTLAAGRGTGAGAPGTLIFQTSTALASGTTAQTLATRLIIGATGAATFGTTAGTGTGDVYAGAYFTGTTAGIDKTCTAAPTALTFNKGILTAATCTDPTPDPLTAAEIADLRGLLAANRTK